MRCSSAALFGVHDVIAAGRGGRPLAQVTNVKPSTSERLLGERRRDGGYRRRRGGVSEVTKRRSDAGREREGERGRAVVASSPERSRAARQMLGTARALAGGKNGADDGLLGDSLVDDGAGRGRRLPLSSHACASAMRLSTRCHKPQRRGGRRRAPRPPRVERLRRGAGSWGPQRSSAWRIDERRNRPGGHARASASTKVRSESRRPSLGAPAPFRDGGGHRGPPGTRRGRLGDRGGGVLRLSMFRGRA